MKEMPKKIMILLVTLAVAVGAVWTVAFFKNTLQPARGTSQALYYCPMHPTYTSDRPGNCPICSMKLVKAEPESVTPAGHEGHSPSGGPLKSFTLQELVRMKPGEICLLHNCKMGKCMMVMTEELARLGKCPHCGEDLGVIIKDLLPEGRIPVKLGSEKQQLIGVKSEPAKTMETVKTIRTVGRIAYDPELYQAQEEYLQAITALRKAEGGHIPEIREQASKLVESATIRLRLFGLNEELIREIEKAGKPDRTLLYSDSGGTMWLYAPIYEYEMPLVKVGQKVEVEIPSIPDKKFQGTIRSLDPVVDPATRSVRARAVLENPEGVLKPEMYVNAMLQVDLGKVLVIPKESVFDTGTQKIVFVDRGQGDFEPRQVTVGAKTEGSYEIKSGIAEGERVVTSGNFLIDSESRLKAALQSMGSGEHRHGG